LTKEEIKKRKTCTSKKAYETFEAARFFSSVFRQTIYQCPYCGKFHLTNQENKKRLYGKVKN